MPLTLGARATKAATGLLLLLLAACDFPRDAEGTLDRVRGQAIRVGVVGNPPWVLAGDEPQGVEPALVRAWAATLGAQVEWVRASESVLVAALERREIHLLIAGLTTHSPWSTRTAFTQPYVDTRWVIAAAADRAGAPLEGAAVTIMAGRPDLAALVRAAGGEPTLSTADHVMLYENQAAAAGRVPLEHVSAAESHVMAGPPGEGAFLLALDRFLHSQRDFVERQLAEAAP
jgi:polar amino acid transport system substrate-binding protein